MSGAVCATFISTVLGILVSLVMLAKSIGNLGATIQKLTDEVASLQEVKVDVKKLKEETTDIKMELTRVATTVDVMHNQV